MICRSPSKKRSTARPPKSKSRSANRAKPATVRARHRVPANANATCATAWAPVRAKQGLFVIERPCPTCNGRGSVIENPCRDCRGEGRVDRPQALQVDIPAGVDTGTRIRLSGKGEAGQPRRAGRRPLHLPPCPAPPCVRTRRHHVDDPGAGDLQPPRRSEAVSKSPILMDQPTGSDIPAGIQSASSCASAGPACPVLQGRGRAVIWWSRSWVETPDAAVAPPEGTAGGIPPRPRPATNAPKARGFFDKLKDVFGG